MAWAGILKALAAIAGFLKTLLLPLAYLLGRRAGRKERDAEQDATNAKAQSEYAKIGVEQRTDEDLDKRLEDGTF